MSSCTLTGLDGASITLERQEIHDSFAGEVVFPDSSGYDETRTLWNSMVDRRPGAIIRVASEQDVVNGVQLASRHGLLLSVRSGGHNIAGKALCDGGLALDLRALNSVEVDSKQRRARVGPGATLGDVDSATQVHGLVVPTGINSTTGIAGLTLGGGFGWTTRKYGLTVDNLQSVRIATADGRVRIANRREDPDLFWAVRGGGGNFGIVTEFEFALHPLGPNVFAGMIVHPLSAAATVVPQYEAAVTAASDDLTCWTVLRKAPPLPFLPAEWHGKEVLVLAVCFIGDPDDGAAAVEPFQSIGAPIAQSLGPMPFVNWQQAFDPLLTPGARNYWKTHDVRTFSREAVRIIQQAVETLPSDECEVFFGHVGGQMSRVDAVATPWPNREAHFAVNVHTRWRESSDDARCVEWARKLHKALSPHAMGSFYVNFIPDGDEGLVAQAYGPNFDRLRELKKRHDPRNIFRANFNIA